MALSLQPSPQTLSPWPPTAHRSPQRAEPTLMGLTADRPRHVDARLLGGRAGPPRSAAQSRGPLELGDQRVALCASLRQPLGVAVERGVIQLVVQLSETLSILPERFAIEHGTSVTAWNRPVTRRSDEH